MTTETPDFSTWPLDRLIEQEMHLGSILILAAEHNDPRKEQWRAEHQAIRKEIARKEASQ